MTSPIGGRATRPRLDADNLHALLLLLDGLAVDDLERAKVEEMRATAYGWQHPLYDLAIKRGRYYRNLAVECEGAAAQLRADHAHLDDASAMTA